jgi:hypothetical protein
MKKGVLTVDLRRRFLMEAARVPGVGGLLVACAVTVAAGQTTQPVALPAVKMGVNDARSGTISQRGDVDVYEFTVERPGIFRFAVRNIPEAIAFGAEIAELQMSMTGPPEFPPWSRFTTGHVRSFRSEPFALPKGTYRIRIKDYFDDGWSAENYTIQTIFTEADDAGEPNDTPETATPLKSGQAVKGCLLPASDADYYAINLRLPGRVTVTVTDIPPEVREGRGVKALYLGILDKDGHVLREFTSSPRQEALATPEMVMHVGTYYVCVRDFNNDDFSASPYTLVARFPAPAGALSEAERRLLAAVREQFEKSGGIDEAEQAILTRLEERFLED